MNNNILSPFDSWLGLPANGANPAPAATLTGTGTGATTSAGGSWWSSLTDGLSSLAKGAAPIVGAVTGNNGTTKPATGAAGNSGTSNLLLIGGLIVGAILFVVFIFKSPK